MSALGRVAAACMLVLALCACTRAAPKSKPGARTTCRCTYLTDFDDTAEVIVEVCVESGKKPADDASFCALQSAHNHIDKCECQPLGAPCEATAKDACVNR